MDGIEALNAMKEGKIVKTKYGGLYRMIGDEIQYYNGGKWEFTEIIVLNDWITDDYELSPEPVEEPVEYNLTFFEAMVEAAFWGDIVCSEQYPKIKYYMKAGVLYRQDGTTANLQACEIKAKWRVVEEEEG